MAYEIDKKMMNTCDKTLSLQKRCDRVSVCIDSTIRSRRCKTATTFRETERLDTTTRSEETDRYGWTRWVAALCSNQMKYCFNNQETVTHFCLNRLSIDSTIQSRSIGTGRSKRMIGTTHVKIYSDMIRYNTLNDG